MNIVGFDTATAATAVAAVRGDQLVLERSVEPAGEERPLHARRLLAELEEAADALGGWVAVDRIGVGVGPGTFTGLRIGIATARGLGQALGKPLAPVVSLAALAGGIATDPEGPAGLRLPVIDARRGQVFAALYRGTGEELWEPFVADPDELAGRIRALDARPVAAGDGSVRFRRQLEQAGATVPGDGDEAHRLAAQQVCRLAAGVDPVGPRDVEPIYLRRPDAELWRERQAG